ncbi:unnamed protein product, partial [Amoebophrya sp. A25]
GQLHNDKVLNQVHGMDETQQPASGFHHANDEVTTATAEQHANATWQENHQAQVASEQTQVGPQASEQQGTTVDTTTTGTATAIEQTKAQKGAIEVNGKVLGTEAGQHRPPAAVPSERENAQSQRLVTGAGPASSSSTPATQSFRTARAAND